MKAKKADRKNSPFFFDLSPFTDSGGMALVLTLMIVAIITAMVVEFAYGVYINTTALYTWQTSQKLSLTAKSATRLASRLISQRSRGSFTKGFYEISQKIPYDNPDGTISLRIEDENGKFNLNSLVTATGQVDNSYAYPAFIRLLRALSLKTDVADRVVDWIDPDSVPRVQDSEKSAKNGYLDSVDELRMIPGIDSGTYEKLLPYVTIYPKATSSNIMAGIIRVNINSAGVPVLMSLSDSITKDVAERIVEYRQDIPFESVADMENAGVPKDICYSLLNYAKTDGIAFRVIATGQSGDIIRTIESVIEGDSRIVRYWKEN